MVEKVKSEGSDQQKFVLLNFPVKCLGELSITWTDHLRYKDFIKISKKGFWFTEIYFVVYQVLFLISISSKIALINGLERANTLHWYKGRLSTIPETLLCETTVSTVSSNLCRDTSVIYLSTIQLLAKVYMRISRVQSIGDIFEITAHEPRCGATLVTVLLLVWEEPQDGLNNVRPTSCLLQKYSYPFQNCTVENVLQIFASQDF